MDLVLLLIGLIAPILWLVGVCFLFAPPVRTAWRRGYQPSALGFAFCAAIASGVVLVPLDVVYTIKVRDSLHPTTFAVWLPYGALLLWIGGPFAGRKLFRGRAEVARAFDEAKEHILRGYDGTEPETSYRWALRHYEMALKVAPASAPAMEGCALAKFYLASVVQGDEGLQLLDEAVADIDRAIETYATDSARALRLRITDYRNQVLDIERST
jgi:hypothetical protein